MDHFSRFVSYYIRNALPFATGFAFALAVFRLDQPWYLLALGGAVLVVVGPLVIEFALTLIVQALRGMPHEDAAGSASLPRLRDSGFRSRLR